MIDKIFQAAMDPVKVEMTLFIADRRINDLMRHFDLRPDYKWYVAPYEATYTTRTVINDEYFLRLIEESKKEPKHWIPAIRHLEKVYHEGTVKELSDGNKILFLL